MGRSGVADRQKEHNGTADRHAASPNYEVALRECAAGCEAGVAKIYVGEARQLHAVAQRIVRNRDHAEDVVHDAFAQILRDAKSFDPARGSARAWIYTIVRNTALKSLRNASREVAVEDDRLVSLCDQQQPLVETSSRVTEGADLRSCIEQIEPKRRASLILAIVDGRTHAEIAEYLGVPIGTVKAWIRRELISLRERLK